MKTVKRTCTATTTKGTRCEAAALAKSSFCFFHDPDRAAERHAAHVDGGRQGLARTLTAADADVPVADSRDVVRLLATTINQVRKGQLDPRVANAVGYLANVLLKAVDQGDVEARLAALEAVLSHRPVTTDLPLSDLTRMS